MEKTKAIVIGIIGIVIIGVAIVLGLYFVNNNKVVETATTPKTEAIIITEAPVEEKTVTNATNVDIEPEVVESVENNNGTDVDTSAGDNEIQPDYAAETILESGEDPAPVTISGDDPNLIDSLSTEAVQQDGEADALAGTN